MNARAARAFGFGLLIAVALQWVQAQAFDGDWTGLLGVGANSEIAPLIQSEIGPVSLWEDVGHDGQISYGIARDLSAQHVPSLLDHGGYRYRRILYPLLAGLGGLLSARSTLLGMIAWAAIGVGLVAAGGSVLSHHFGLSSWFWLQVILNPGLWLSAQLLTPDALGFGLAFLGFALWLDGRKGWALALLALAPLAKDQFALVGLVLAFWEFGRANRRSAVQLALTTTLPLLLWSVIVESWIGGGLSPRSNFDWPLFGILKSAGTVWPLVGGKDLFYTVVALAGVVLALVGGATTRHQLLRWSAWAWAAVGLLASSWVWDLGNNAVRALAPGLAFGVLAIVHRISAKVPAGTQPLTSSRKNLPV